MTKTSISKLETKRGNIFNQLDRFKTFLNNISPETQSQLIFRIKKVEDLWSDFESIQGEIESHYDSPDHVQTRSDFENTYFQLLSEAKEIINQKPMMCSAQVQQQDQNNIKLPKIHLPIFYGDNQQWITFHDTFYSLIHTNQNLSNVQKFHYLISSLKGPAREIVHSLEITDLNYPIAWELLKNRFANKKIITNAYLKDLFNLPTINSKHSHEMLRKLIDSVNKNLRALQSLGQPVQHWDTIIIYLINTKLDVKTRLDWERASSKIELSSLDHFLKFLSEKCTILETINPNKNYFHLSNEKQKISKSFVVIRNTCQICKENHNIYHCKSLLKLSVHNRIKTIKLHNLCINCLKPNHTLYNCQSKNTCKHCGKRHNTLLHVSNSIDHSPKKQDTNTPHNSNSSETNNGPIGSVSVHTSNISCPNLILLSTALIAIFDANGHPHLCRALLDSGSQSNFISLSLYKKLKLKKFKINFPIHGIAGSVAPVEEGLEATIKSRINNFSLKSTFLILENITDSLPSSSISKGQLYIPGNIQLADPKFYISSKIDILLGASVFWDLLCVGQIKGGFNQPTYQKTKLGWVAIGNIPSTNIKLNHLSCNVSINKVITNQLEKFWKIEEVDTEPILSQENISCKKHFLENTTRDQTGRFLVKLPFKLSPSSLGSSFQLALNRFYNLEKRLNKNLEMITEYANFIKEYELLGHMIEVKPTTFDLNNNNYYLPHHGVYKESTTTKLRVVFDGSAKTTTNLSLNDILMVGPNIQQDLFQILTRFRKHNIVLSADIEKMYRQVLVHPDHRKYQMILWRDNPKEPIKHFTLNTVTYGTASASYLAIQCLHQLGLINQNSFPTESKTILNDFYVDDLLTGSETPEQAINLIKGIQNILQSGGFNLRKWSSNNKEIMKQLVYTNKTDQLLLNPELSKTLGLFWNSNSDTLHYNFKATKVNHSSKRIILTLISKLFDPLGLLGPLIITAKLILQKLFQLNLNWDESIPMDLHTQWIDFYSSLNEINNFSIPRQICYQSPINIELHGFCDASERAYGACIYIRSTNSKGEHMVRLLCAKSKVAPIKSISLPKLELSGALLLTRLAKKLLSSLEINFCSHYFWTDSTIVLAWLNHEPNTLKTFVANRISEIQQNTKLESWKFISGKSNPADLISRGVPIRSLKASTLWWNGPSWLRQNSDQWPISKINQDIISNFAEEKINTMSYHAIIKCNIFEKFSSFLKLQRVIAYCFRFINNCNNNQKLSGPLTPFELNHSLVTLVRLAQMEGFHQEYQALKNSKSINSNSKLLALSPFIDDKLVLRVGGRLSKSNLDYNKKHQILLPKYHKLTELIIMSEHLKNLHLGPRALLSNIRSRFWIPNGINIIKRILKNCIVCFKVQPIKQTYQMGDLPKARVTPSRPFTNCGVDFAGPFNMRSSKLRNCKIIKVYLCIFICFSTKAVHLEIVTDLTSEAFLCCLRRFIARRGKCLNIYSDNATNFHGADNHLKGVAEFFNNDINKNQITNFLSQDGIAWHFIPPKSPHFGGIWETAVRSAKQHLKRVMGNNVLTFEELLTLFSEIKACLNSRPLTPMSDDPNDLTALTPGHFLIGESLISPPQENLCSDKILGVQRYKLVLQMMQHFWGRWSKEYLNSLQQRTKWQINNQNIKLNSLVLIKEDNLPPLKWSLGRIVEMHPGTDQVVRVVSVRTKDGIFRRALNNICILPIDIA